MKYLSLFSGIEAATVAWHPLGWTPVAFSEIDKTASKFLAETYPHVPNLGDVTKITEEMVKSLGKIDVIIGGSPCQAFSVAGLRKGLDDPRGNLTLEFVRIVSLVMPEFVVWENVPGVLSDKTNAFLCLMDGLSELGYAIDTQELDAQEFYVPQRRKRVFLVCRKIGAKKKTHISWKTTGLLEQEILDLSSEDQDAQCKSEQLLSGFQSNTFLGVKMKSNIYAQTMLENLGKILLITLAELSGQSRSTQSSSVLHGVSIHTLQPMMRKLGMPSQGLETLHTWSEYWSHLLKGLDEVLGQLVSESAILDCHLGWNQGRKKKINLEESTLCATAEEKWSIESLLLTALGEVYQVMNASITSTWTSETIALRTYCFVKTVASIGMHISSLNLLLGSLFVEDSLFLTAIKESTNYAKKSNVKRLIEIGRCSYSDDLPTQAGKNNTLLDFGDWESRPPILLEPEGLRGDSEPSRKTRENTTSEAESSAEVCRRIGHDAYVDDNQGSTLSASSSSMDQGDLVLSAYCIQATTIGRSDTAGANGAGYSEELAFTLNTVDRHVAAYSFDSLSSNSMKSSNPDSGCREVDLAKTLDTTTPCPSKNQGGIAILNPPIVRRLTPLECERLQGFPENYTASMSNSQRYRTLGNSMAVPVIRYIGEKIMEAIRYNIVKRKRPIYTPTLPVNTQVDK